MCVSQLWTSGFTNCLPFPCILLGELEKVKNVGEFSEVGVEEIIHLFWASCTFGDEEGKTDHREKGLVQQNNVSWRSPCASLLSTCYFVYSRAFVGLTSIPCACRYLFALHCLFGFGGWLEEAQIAELQSHWIWEIATKFLCAPVTLQLETASKSVENKCRHLNWNRTDSNRRHLTIGTMV